jgi:hypothetical protein
MSEACEVTGKNVENETALQRNDVVLRANILAGKSEQGSRSGCKTKATSRVSI